MTKRYQEVKGQVAQAAEGQGMKMVEQRRVADQQYTEQRPKGTLHLPTIRARERGRRVR